MSERLDVHAAGRGQQQAPVRYGPPAGPLVQRLARHEHAPAGTVVVVDEEGVAPGGRGERGAVAGEQVEPGAGVLGPGVETTSARASPSGSPARRRGNTAAASQAESQELSGSPTCFDPPASSGSPAFSGAPVGSPTRSLTASRATRPLWLSSHRPSAKGAVAVSSTGMPTVADRTAASRQCERAIRARAGRFASVQMGTARR
nr:hypothetical protein GCM10020093_012140 [Planobispora longispora]